MKQAQQKTILMRLRFSDRHSARPGLEDVGRDLAVSVNILRGRISQEEASFELEVTGPAERIKEFIRMSESWRASAGTSSAGVA